VPFVGSTGKVLGTIVVTKDITKEKTCAEELANYSQVAADGLKRGNFTEYIEHFSTDLPTPLLHMQQQLGQCRQKALGPHILWWSGTQHL
jgi:hypothetical protein